MKPAALGALLLVSACARATPPPGACLLQHQTRMLAIELYMGTDIPGRAPVTQAEWDRFTADEIAPRFPDGFTTLTGDGQWLNPKTGQIGREASHLVRIWTRPTPDIAARVTAITAAYKAQFRQQAVGVTTTEGCAGFNE